MYDIIDVYLIIEKHGLIVLHLGTLFLKTLLYRVMNYLSKLQADGCYDAVCRQYQYHIGTSYTTITLTLYIRGTTASSKTLHLCFDIYL